MSNTFKKTGFRGFTLIELLVVIAIIGLLSTIIAAPIQSARKKARDAKKIAELKSTQLALEQYAESNSAQYPIKLSTLSPQFMPVLSGFAASTTSTARDAFTYVYYNASSTGSASDNIFSYHMGAKLEVYGPALETDRDCFGASLSNALTVPNCTVYNGNYMIGTGYDNGSNIFKNNLRSIGTYALGVPGGFDFETATSTFSMTKAPAIYTEDSSSTCVAINDCVFDVTSQQ